MGIKKSNTYRNKHTKYHKVIYINKNGNNIRPIQQKHEEGWFEKLVHRFLDYISN